MTWRNAPWHLAAGLAVCTSEACGAPEYDEDGDCLRCGLPRAEHVVVPIPQA